MTISEFNKLVYNKDLIGFKLIDVNNIIWTIDSQVEKNDFMLISSDSKFMGYFNVYSCWRFKLYVDC